MAFFALSMAIMGYRLVPQWTVMTIVWEALSFSRCFVADS